MRCVHAIVGVVVGVAGCAQISAPLPSARTFTPKAASSTPDSGTPTSDTPTPDACPDPLSWANTGEPYMLTYCAGCHASTVDSAFRYGAPEDLWLDSAEDARAHSARIHARITDGTMPPTGGPSAAENTCFLAWLAQGARGRGIPLASRSAAPTATVAWEVLETTDSSGTDALVLTTTLVGLGRPVATGVWAEELWRIDGDDAWLVARTRLEPGSGTVLTEDTWDPPLRLSWGTTTDSWTLETTRTHTTAAGTQTLAETWDIDRSIAAATDPRSIDTAPVQVLAIERTTGIEVGIELSDRMGAVRRWTYDPTATGDPDLDLVDILYFESRLPDLPPGFPLGPGMEWSARILGDAP